MHLDVDDEYLGILDQLTHQLAESVAFIYHQGSGPHPLVTQLLERHGRDAVQWAVHSRAGHLQTPPPRSLVGGAVRCGQGRDQKNVLLPDGSVALCCMDWGLEHVLGNLLDQEYDELFTSAPYLELKAGLSDGTGGRLCRVCEWVESCEAPPHP